MSTNNALKAISCKRKREMGLKLEKEVELREIFKNRGDNHICTLLVKIQ